jgi:hypothetical protein
MFTCVQPLSLQPVVFVDPFLERKTKSAFLAQGSMTEDVSSQGEPSSLRHLLSWPEPVLFPVNQGFFLVKTKPYELTVQRDIRLSVDITVVDISTPDAVLARAKPMVELVHIPHSAPTEKRVLAMNVLSLVDRTTRLAIQEVPLAKEDLLWIRTTRQETAKYRVTILLSVSR